MKLTTKLIRAKSDFDYGRNNGFSYLFAVMQFAIFIKIFKLSTTWYYIVIPLFFAITWLWGVILRRINFRKRESSFINNENPEMMDIYKAIKK